MCSSDLREAAVMRTPSVVVENTAPAEVITDRFNGLICQNNADSLADKLYYFLFYINEQQRYSIAENARLTIPVGWDEIMRSVMERYSYVISKGHKNEKVFAPFEALLTTEKKKPEITNLMDKK